VRTLLVANRGEIAVRIMRSARELGIRSVAVCSEADVGALHVRAADMHVVIGPAPAARSYLDVDALLAAAVTAGADAVHPGYGFLSERADFATRVVAAGLVFVGPSAEAIRLMGDKAQARAMAARAGVPTLPGSAGLVEDLASALAAAEVAGYPVAIKASAGGGGRGIRVAENARALREMLPVAQAEAAAAFGSGAVYLERFVARGRHIEVQVFGDGEHVVHLGERECSLQRRRQKVIEESPAPGLSDVARAAMAAAAVRLADQVRYQGAGTVEFLYDQEREEFSFLEMNTRIQVEHPVTEMVVGRDLVAEQLNVAAGSPLSFGQADVVQAGHAIEFRLNAEDPNRGFLPSPGVLAALRLPGGPFVRVDSGYETGCVVPPYYDSLLAKVVVWGQSRAEALARARRCLAEVETDGISTTASLLRQIVEIPEFQQGRYHTTFLEQWLASAQGLTAEREGVV